MTDIGRCVKTAGEHAANILAENAQEEQNSKKILKQASSLLQSLFCTEAGRLDLKVINDIIIQAKESKIYGAQLSIDKYWRICKYCKQTRGSHHNSFCKVDNTGKKFKDDSELTKISTAIYILYGGHIP